MVNLCGNNQFNSLCPAVTYVRDPVINTRPSTSSHAFIFR